MEFGTPTRHTSAAKMSRIIPCINTNVGNVGSTNFFNVLPSGLSPEARTMALYASKVAKWKRTVF